MDVIQKALAGDLEIFCKTADLSDAAFPTIIPTVDEPTGNGVINLTTGEGAAVPNGIGLLPIGTGANDAVVTGFRIYGWKYRRANAGSGSTRTKGLWIPYLLAQFAGVCSATTGVDGTDIPSTYFFLDTITLTTGNANVSNEIISPTGDVIAHCLIANKGCRKLQMTLDMGANLTGFNGLWWPY
jgi:hypothetical protein